MKNRFDFHVLRKRQQIIAAIREFFRNRDFLEIETPCIGLSADPSVHIDSFQTSLKYRTGHQVKAYLQPSPELFMKRLIAEGSGDIFEIRTKIAFYYHLGAMAWYWNESMSEAEGLFENDVDDFIWNREGGYGLLARIKVR